MLRASTGPTIQHSSCRQYHKACQTCFVPAAAGHSDSPVRLAGPTHCSCTKSKVLAGAGHAFADEVLQGHDMLLKIQRCDLLPLP